MQQVLLARPDLASTLDTLAAGPAEVHLWRPADLAGGTITAVLAGRRPPTTADTIGSHDTQETRP